MGLNVVVGVFSEFDEDESQEFAEDFAVVRRELAAVGFPDWQEPELGEDEVVVQDMYGYSGLHHLRRVAAHLAASGEMPASAGEDPERDPVLMAAYQNGPVRFLATGGTSVEHNGPAGSAGGLNGGRRAFDHLIQHSDADGYYVPVDFVPVLRGDDLLGGYLGSSQRLLEECLLIAEALDLSIDLDPESDEVQRAVDGEVEEPATWQRHGIASYTCLQLIGAAWHSIRTGAAIAFC
ncbi:MAG TPA: hypothetical protein VGP70_25740 [Actinomadura sp.]|jgi:hypothetical protein|nr:hypothetical protein [Actinomadura sp.]